MVDRMDASGGRLGSEEMDQVIGELHEWIKSGALDEVVQMARIEAASIQTEFLRAKDVSSELLNLQIQI